MFRLLRARMSYANVVATLAPLFAMAGGAMAAGHYLITSSKQISPKVLKELKRTGPQGPAGPTGSPGAAGTAGTAGTPGAPGTNGSPGGKGETGERGAEGPPSGNEPHWRKTIAKASGESAATAAQTTLFEAAPFKLTGRAVAEPRTGRRRIRGRGRRTVQGALQRPLLGGVEDRHGRSRRRRQRGRVHTGDQRTGLLILRLRRAGLRRRDYSEAMKSSTGIAASVS